ncbi:hypothetical protein CsSME_00024446 [Camellia sinensis var. sinensis]
MESINCTIDLDCKGILYPAKLCEEQIVKQYNYHPQQGVRVDLSSYKEEDVLSSNKEEDDLTTRMVSFKVV